MNTLNLGSDDEPVKKKKNNTRNLKIALGLAAVILIPTIGSTLAGTISVGSGTVEFGQGAAATAACDDSINIIPTTTYTSSGSFALTSISVGSLELGCVNKYLKIKVINSSDAAVIIGAASNTYCQIQFVSVASASVTVSPSSCALTAATTTGFTFTPAFTQGAVTATKITLESSDAP